MVKLHVDYDVQEVIECDWIMLSANNNECWLFELKFEWILFKNYEYVDIYVDIWVQWEVSDFEKSDILLILYVL